MSHLIVITLAIVSVAVTTCRALPDIHKQMSAQQLQSVFHVESAEAVPQYEVIQLLHHHNEETPSSQQYNNYRRRKRSIETISPTEGLHHVKKDLSKTPYYSEAKLASAKKSQQANSLTGDLKKIKDIHEHKVQVAAFGQKLNLTLKKTQGLFKKGELHNLPMWFMDKEANATQGVNLEKIEDEHSHSSENIGEVYQDEENMAAILMRRHEITGDLIMEGSIGHDMVIKPLPHELSPSAEESHHVIYKRSADPNEHLSDFAYMEPDDLATHDKLEKLQERRKRAAHRNTLVDLEEEQEQLEEEDGVAEDESSPHRRAKRQAPYMIYPEVLVIVDYDGYRLHGGDNLQVKRYFIAFWNGVDLRYRLLKEPKIRVSIAGIIISRGRDATPYLERNRVGRDAIDSAAALTDMGKYLFRERRLPVYDIAVAITKLDMCRREYGAADCNRGTAGFAYVGGACVVNRRLEKVNSVAIIEDTGGFSGIIVAAHEVGHLLGAVHDGSPPPSYLGGPGAQRCRWEDGFIMSDLRHTERGFRWSACSVQSFQHFLNGATATCLYNVPHEDNALGRSLPGTLLSLDAQCRRDRGTYACFKDERVCAQLFCFDAQTGYCVAYRPAAEGSTCGNNLHCLDGRCAALQVASNLIPNYGAQYRLGYKSNEAIGEDNESKAKEITNVEEDEDEEEDDDDDEDEEEDQNDQDEKQKQQKNNSSEEEEEEEDDDEEEEEEEEDSKNEKVENKLGHESEENSSESQENDDSSSPHGSANDDDDEEYLTDEQKEPLAQDLHKQYEHNHIDKPNDNRYEESMVKRQDNEQTDNLQTLGQRPLINLNTYQYLSQLWQNLQTYTTTTTTTTTTTKNPLTVLHKQRQEELEGHTGYAVLKSVTKSKSSGDSRRNATRNTLQQHYTDIITTLKPRTLHLSTTTTTNTPTTQPNTPSTSTFVKTLRKQFQYYVKLLQANTDSNRSRTSQSATTTTTTTTLNKPYYNSHTILPSKPYSSSLSNAASKHLYNHNKANGNGGHNNNGGDGDNEGDNEEDDNEDDNDNEDDDDDGGDDNDESNETIEKQKRKLTLPISTTTTTMQQQLQMQASPPTPTTTTSTSTSHAASLEKASATIPPHYGGSRSSPTLFDTYVKKLQALNVAAAAASATEATPLRTTEQQDSKTLDKTEITPHPTSQFEGQFLKRTPTLSSFSSSSSGSSSGSSNSGSISSPKNPYTKPIKSTATTTTANAAAAAAATASSSSSGSSSYTYIPQPLKSIEAEAEAEEEEVDTANTHRQQTPQTSPAYVTNYIGDNSNRLASIVQQHQQPQQHHQPQSHHQQQQQQHQQQQKTLAKLLQQTNNSHQQQSPTGKQHKHQHQAPPPPQQLQQQHQHHHQTQQQQQSVVVAFSSSTTTTTTRRPKIKTQKLIRRLRTQIK